MNLETFKKQLTKGDISFEQTMAIIDQLYTFTETAFDNDGLHNDAGQNSGSCKLFSFAKLHNFNQQQTLNCFGQYYHDDVINNPNGDNHQNIRHFMTASWAGITFKGEALTVR